MRKPVLNLLVVLGCAVSLVTACYADVIYKYLGTVKSVDVKKSTIVFCPEHAKKQHLPSKIPIELKKDDFERIKYGYDKAKSNIPPKPLTVNVQYVIKDKKNVAKSIIIVPGGC